jgi:hypothetical protein
LSESDKCEYLLQAGFPLQKVWAMQNFHFLAAGSSKSILQQIFVKVIQKNVVNWPEELQLECSNGLLNALKMGLLSDDLKLESIELSLTFLSFYSRTLHQRWLPVFKYLLPMIPVNTTKSKLIPELMLLSDFSQKAITRQVSCHLLASLCSVIPKDFKGALLQRVKSLSQDTNPEVREEMSKVWLEIIKAVGRTVLEETIFFDILKLVEDEVEAVKCGGIRLLITSLELYSEAFFQKEVQQVLITHVYSTKSLKIEEVLSENFGVLLTGSHGMKAENLALGKKMLGKDVNFRKYLAFNFPGFVQITGICNELKDIAVSLASDSNVQVKEIFAAGFHEVLCLNKTCKILKKIATKLVEEAETRVIVLKKLSQWAGLFDPGLLLVKLIKMLTSPLEWRLQVTFLLNFQEALLLFPLKEVLDHLVPLLLHKMLTAHWPVKKTASETLALIIHHTFYICRKLDLCSIVKEKFAKSRSSSERMLFIDFVETFSCLCSKKFFTRHFLEDFLSLASDPAVNVQIRFLDSLENFSLNGFSELALKKIKEIQYSTRVTLEKSQKVLERLNSKEFEVKCAEVSAKDRQRELFEVQQELQEVREMENNKKKAADEIALKLASEPGKKKMMAKGKVQSESTDLKRGTRSTAVIKPIVPRKK